MTDSDTDPIVDMSLRPSPETHERNNVPLWVVVLLVAVVGWASAGRASVVLLYHRFGDGRYPSTNVPLEMFDAHLEYLAGNGYRVVPLADVVAAARGEVPLPDRAVAITVDDAFATVYENAYPRLKARGWPFTVFVATDPVDGGQGDFMTWDQMREMAAHGVTFANHGASHGHLADRLPGEGAPAWLDRVRTDIEKGRRRLETELGEAPPWFAYPYGEYDLELAGLVASLGNTAFGQQSGAVGPSSDLRALPRFPMGGPYTSLQAFPAKVASLPLPVIDQTPWNPVTTERRPVLELTLGSTDALLAELACFVGGQGRVPVVWIDPGHRLRVRPVADLPRGRSRVNCTAPDPARTRYHWFSHPWLVRRGGAEAR